MADDDDDDDDDDGDVDDGDDDDGDAQGRRRVCGDGERLEVCGDGARPALSDHIHPFHHYRNLCRSRRSTSRYCNIGNQRGGLSLRKTLTEHLFSTIANSLLQLPRVQPKI